MSSVKSCPGLIECFHSLSHESLKDHREKSKSNNDYFYLLDLYLQSQIEILAQERLLQDYNNIEIKSIIPLDLKHPENELVMITSTNEKVRSGSFDDYTKEKSSLIIEGLDDQGKLIPYVFDHITTTAAAIVKKKKKKRKKENSYSVKSLLFVSTATIEDHFIAFRYPKTVDVHTLRSFTIRLLIGLSPPYLKKKK